MLHLSPATCSDMFDHKALKAFLQERGLYDKGLWKHLCPKTKSKGLKFGERCSLADMIYFFLMNIKVVQVLGTDNN